jgi:hypothetical protein
LEPAPLVMCCPHPNPFRPYGPRMVLSTGWSTVSAAEAASVSRTSPESTCNICTRKCERCRSGTNDRPAESSPPKAAISPYRRGETAQWQGARSRGGLTFMHYVVAPNLLQ